MRLQARVWYRQHRFEEAKSGALRAVDIYERVGATKDAEDCRVMVRNVEKEMKKAVTSDGLSISGESLEAVLLHTPINTPFSARGTGHRLTSSSQRIISQTRDPASGQMNVVLFTPATSAHTPHLRKDSHPRTD